MVVWVSRVFCGFLYRVFWGILKFSKVFSGFWGIFFWFKGFQMKRFLGLQKVVQRIWGKKDLKVF